jgi:nucleoside-diphosphate-sugar epimerase
MQPHAAAAGRIRALVAEGRLGAGLTAEVRFGAPPPPEAREPGFWTGRGVLAEHGPAVLGLLGAWLGPLSLEDFVDDSAGGPEAECRLRLRAGPAACTVELSRLRPLANRIVLTGDDGRAELDLDTGELRAEPSSLADVAPAPVESLDAASLIDAAYRTRRRALHVWEDADDAAGEPLLGRKVLVTGGLGFIGARLVEKLVARGAEVTAASRDLRRAPRVARLDVRLIRLDATDPAALRAAVEGQAVVINLAYDFRRSAAGNLKAYRLLAEACLAAGVPRFVQASSIAVYDGWPGEDLTEASRRDGPGHPYKTTKRAIERDLAARAARGELQVAVLQPTIVYGPFSAQWTDGFVGMMRRAPTRLPPADGLCNGAHVDDVADALIAAAVAEAPPAGGLIVSGPRPFPWTRMFEAYAAAVEARLLPPAETPPTPAGGGSLLGRLRAFAAGPVAGGVTDWLVDRIGADRLAALTSRLGGGAQDTPAVLDPAAGEPALFTARGVCSVEALGRTLGPPQIDSERGLGRTSAYLRWRFGGAAFGEPSPPPVSGP